MMAKPPPCRWALKRVRGPYAGLGFAGLGSPVLLASLATLWIQKGKALASEMRCGYNGRPFRMYRFNVDRSPRT